MSKTLLLLGGARYALPVIKAAHELGAEVVTCDYLPHNYDMPSRMTTSMQASSITRLFLPPPNNARRMELCRLPQTLV